MTAAPLRSRLLDLFGRRSFRWARRRCQVLLQLGRGYGTRDSAAVGEEQGWGTVDVQGVAELLQGIDRVAAARLGWRQLLFVHPLVPGLRAIRGAPDRVCLGRRLRMKGGNRKQEHVHGEVVDGQKRFLELLAERTVRIGEHRELTAAVA